MSYDFHTKVPDFSHQIAPFVFSSSLCREQHFHMPLYTFWCQKLGEKMRFHRKQWEFVYICQVLHERGYLKAGNSGIGFGVGKEPLTAYFASQGCQILATDLALDKAQELGWTSHNDHCHSLFSLNTRDICPQDVFLKNTRFEQVDMNHIPSDLGNFDFCWSSCAFEHLGSIRHGLDFVLNSSKLLKPGGLAVHTTEYNLTSNEKTLDNNPNCVIFRKRDIEQLALELRQQGYTVAPINYTAGEDELERYIDLPPYLGAEPHLRLQLEEFVCTSIGIIITAPNN